MQLNTASNKALDSISVDEAGSLPGLFKCRIERSPKLPAYQQYDQKQNSWLTYSLQEIGVLVARWPLTVKAGSISVMS